MFSQISHYILCLSAFIKRIYGVVEKLVNWCTFFIISGNPEGFSAIWICMLPTCGMLLFGRKNTTILCAIMLVIMVFFFQTPQGVSLLWYDYTASFRMRFPILFSAFYLLSLLLESIREITQRELDKMRLKYEYLYSHDFLTSMLNRHGLMEWEKREKVSSRQAVLMFDIDFFKKVNDSYGHDIGDIVLAGVSAEVAKHVPTSICRWGGEEFVVWFPHGNLRDEEAERIRAAVEELEIFIPHTEKRVPVTISIGVARAAGEVPLSELIKRADACLYEAKAQGRNRVVFEPKT